MSPRRLVAAALAAGTLGLAGLTCLTAAPAAAAPSGANATIIGKLGYEGGAFPGRFKPTAGTVFTQFDGQPLELTTAVGPTGTFKLHLSPGTYTLTGCGPGTSTSPVGRCGQPVTVTLAAHEKDHLKLVWLMAP